MKKSQFESEKAIHELDRCKRELEKMEQRISEQQKMLVRFCFSCLFYIDSGISLDDRNFELELYH